MNIFKTILSKLGFGGADKDETASAGSASATPSVAQSSGASSSASVSGSAGASAGVTAISDVDVVSRLESLAASHGEKLNWKVSIVDLLKLLDIDSSLQSRKDLATELGCPAEKMGDSAQMNMWLHKTVLKKLAQNGGNVPADLLD